MSARRVDLRRLCSTVAVACTALAATSTTAAAAEFVDYGIDPRYRTIPRPVMPVDPSIPTPAKLTTYALHERSGVVHIEDGSWEDLPYTYEVLVDGRVLQEQGPGNVDFWSGHTSIPFRTSIYVSDLEPGTQHELGVRRLTPDWRRSATKTITVTTPGTRVPDAERPPVPELVQVRTRGTTANLVFKPGRFAEPYELSSAGIDLKIPGRELQLGTSSEGQQGITGLTPSTTYRAEVRSRNIRGDTSAWVPVSFTTAPKPDVPLQAPELRISTLSTHGADVSWEPVRDLVGELAQPWYRVDGGPEYPAIQTDTEMGRLQYWTAADGKSLQPGTTHRVDLWWIDKDGRRTETKTITFTTKSLPQPTTPAPTTPQPTTPLPTTPAATTPTPTPAPTTPTTPHGPEPTTPAVDALAPTTPAAATPEPTAGVGTQLSVRAEPLPVAPAGPTPVELRGVPLAFTPSGTTLLGTAAFGRTVAADGITVKVAIRGKDCRWWRFGQARFAGLGRKAQAARSTTCVTPPAWRAVRTTWSGRSASIAIPVGERLPAGRYAVRVRFQRGAAVLAERTAAVAVR